MPFFGRRLKLGRLKIPAVVDEANGLQNVLNEE
jgi:hypothetical protein